MLSNNCTNSSKTISTAVEKYKVFKLTEGRSFYLESNVGEGLFFAGTNHAAKLQLYRRSNYYLDHTDLRRAEEAAQNAPTVITPDQTQVSQQQPPLPAEHNKHAATATQPTATANMATNQYTTSFA